MDYNICTSANDMNIKKICCGAFKSDASASDECYLSLRYATGDTSICSEIINSDIAAECKGIKCNLDEDCPSENICQNSICIKK